MTIDVDVLQTLRAEAHEGLMRCEQTCLWTCIQTDCGSSCWITG
ncbi:hypothetical protein Ssi03_39970 [Sphaerisporangium siamense]|uniref:Uncharacterized protein n=2 Tax=Sphaerisporangium TaxID=321315 RepID=A0A7W8Z518_9ACTN|nr:MULTISPECIES: hypothetical protein [Sphaerisporangium]MBB4700848.1 hypothetical protein [Sphaerisporangium siamense]MBB5627375.1 hypothetical protein [Sphaerisporangium krabiense]GII64489.1 hypothetical protein Skr01_45740 [Sphaerisporangium krabiense]GII86007.1 hypothetical protein Ssi03_39970 [Sphaerisporangium siamense]